MIPADLQRWLDRFAEDGDDRPLCVTLANAAGVDVAVSAFSAGPPVELEEGDDGWTEDAWTAHFGSRGASVVVIEDNGWAGASERVITRLGIRGRSACVYWSVNLDSQVHLVEDGVMLCSFDPVTLELPLNGYPIEEYCEGARPGLLLELIDGLDFDADPVACALTVIERFTGMQISDQEWDLTDLEARSVPNPDNNPDSSVGAVGDMARRGITENVEPAVPQVPERRPDATPDDVTAEYVSPWRQAGRSVPSARAGDFNRLLLVGGPADTSPASGTSARFRSVVGDQKCCFALDDRGGLWVWGSNHQGRLGLGHLRPVSKPELVPGLPPVVDVEEQFTATLALTTDGQYWSWGRPMTGMLPDGVTRVRRVPEPVPGLPPIRSVFRCPEGAFLLDSKGGLYAWGDGSQAMLGDGVDHPRPRPGIAPVAGLPAVDSVAAAGNGVTALGRDGTVWVWGNFARTAGYGAPDVPMTPHQVPGLSGITAIVAGAAVDGEGALWVWRRTGDSPEYLRPAVGEWDELDTEDLDAGGDGIDPVLEEFERQREAEVSFSVQFEEEVPEWVREQYLQNLGTLRDAAEAAYVQFDEEVSSWSPEQRLLFLGHAPDDHTEPNGVDGDVGQVSHWSGLRVESRFVEEPLENSDDVVMSFEPERERNGRRLDWYLPRSDGRGSRRGAAPLDLVPVQVPLPGPVAQLVASSEDRITARLIDGTVWTWGAATAQAFDGQLPAEPLPVQIAGVVGAVHLFESGQHAASAEGEVWAWDEGSGTPEGQQDRVRQVWREPAADGAGRIVSFPEGFLVYPR